MATQKLTAGAVAWSTVTVTLTSLASGSAIASSAISNTTNLDLFMDVSISIPSITPTGTPIIGVYLYPLNQDGTTYGDGRFGSATAALPPASYFVGNIGLNPAASVQTGTLQFIRLPFNSFKLVFYNGTGVALSASASTVKYQTYNYSVA